VSRHTWPAWSRSPQLDETSELDRLRSLEQLLSARVHIQQQRAGGAIPQCLALRLLERVRDELATVD